MRLVRIESSEILNFTRSIRLGLTSIQNLKFANDNLPFIFAQLNFPRITLKHYSGEEDPDSRRTHDCSLQKKPTVLVHLVHLLKRTIQEKSTEH